MIERMDARTILTGLSAAALLLFVQQAGAQTAREIVDQALTHSDARLEDVRTVRVVQRMEVPGSPSVVDTLHLEKVMEGGHAFLVPEDGQTEHSPTRMVRQLAEVAEYAGTETVDGHETHVLVAEDADILRRWAGGAVDSMMTGSESQVDVRIDELRTYLDTESYVLRKTTMDLTLERNGESSTVEHEQVHKGYETFDGLYPRTRILRTSGITALSAEEMAQAREGMEQARRELEDLPEAQREMAEQYMGEGAGAMGSGSMEIVIRVLEVDVNGG